MKKLSRFSALLLAVLMPLSLAACGGGGQSTDKEFSAGVTDGNTYTNEYFGFAATLDENWTMLTKDQITQITGQTAEALNDENLAKMYDDGKVVMEMYGVRSDNSTVNITVENLGTINGAKYDESGYVVESLKQLPDQLSAGGFTDIKTEKTTVIFAGTEHDGITITANVQSTAVHEVLACVKVGNYVAVITAVTFGDSNPSEILDLFKAI
ncbi:putative uncharacterized protein [Firmicutes bacterium CAG:555]|mgnify:FL=1|nr:putative uncharacterized protein [Firmicutes bacterium CAG:555]